MKYKHLFGPVPSRRLGVSLGVDLIPFKTCTLDCVYCECGKTTNLTTAREEYVPLQAVMAELDNYLADNPPLDYITFSGSGEPTLHSGIGEIIAFLKSSYPHYKICLLTNGTLFFDPETRSAVKGADLIIPSLDAATEKTFRLINRPHRDLNCAAMIEGLIKLRQEYPAEINLEVFIVPGLNDTLGELSLLKAAIAKIRPDRIQLGTLDRPGTEDWVEAADGREMREIAAYLGNAELISEFQPRQSIASFKTSYSRQILQTLRRRPCTIEDLQHVLNLHPAEIQKYVNHLLESGRIEVEQKERGIFLKIKNAPEGYA